MKNNLWYAHDDPGGSTPKLDLYGGSFIGSLVGKAPEFIGPATGDYHLKAESPARGAGDSSESPGADYDGKCSAQPPSLGALEYQP